MRNAAPYFQNASSRPEPACHHWVPRLILPAAAMAIWGANAIAQDAYVSPSTLKKLSVEQLVDIDVTSVSKYPEKFSEAAAAVAVLTSEDIERSGVTKIPDALRLVPGLDVAQVDAHTWAISSRGFNDIFADKLLVLIDGRTVYTPLFSGVFWDFQDTLLADIDRIEVVRGPGATLWGANAVNGVINIITKSARDTQGFLVSTGGGTEDRDFVNVRYGVKIDDDTFARVYVKYFDRDSSVLPDGTDAHDAWDMFRGGFRLDSEPSNENSFTLQGDIYTGNEDEVYSIPTTTPPFATTVASTDQVSGGNLLGRWTHTFAPDSQLTLQAYYDRTEQETPIFGEKRDTGDVDLQDRFDWGDRQKIIWGAGFRVTHTNIKNSLNVSFFPSDRTLTLYSAFVQDEISIVPDRLHLTIGSKFEHNDFTGFEIQPSARALWTPGHSQTIWGSISRAVRTPSEAESDVRLNPAPPVPIPPGFLTIHGNPNMESEKLIAYELGYRVQPINQLKVDLTGFYNDYDDLRTLEPLLPGPVSPSIVKNKLFGETYGVELSATAQVTRQWRLQGSYSYFDAQLHREPGSRDTTTEAIDEGSSPHNQFFIRSLLDVGWNIQFDSTLRYVDVLPLPKVPSYITLDLRLAWSPRKDLEFAVVGRNLLDDRHPEFAPTFIGTQRTEVERSVYGMVVWHY
jgi:iron complex outermembrane receptor protein